MMKVMDVMVGILRLLFKFYLKQVCHIKEPILTNKLVIITIIINQIYVNLDPPT